MFSVADVNLFIYILHFFTRDKPKQFKTVFLGPCEHFRLLNIRVCTILNTKQYSIKCTNMMHGKTFITHVDIRSKFV